MPAKKIIEAVTSTLAVMGSSMATATAGPMPGSTPTAVPSTQPTKHHSRLVTVSADAKPRYLEPSGAGPLGSGTGFPLRSETLEVGDTVLLYTDGLVERRDEALAVSVAALADAAGALQDVPPDELVTTLARRVVTAVPGDDVVLLAIQVLAPTGI